MKKRNCILMGIAVLMILTASVPSALAYFTTYVSAKGMKPVVLGERTEIEEPDFTNWTKKIVITAENPSEPVYVRAQAFAPEGIVLVYSGTNWSQPDSEGWCYYSDPISNGQSANELDVQIRVRNENGELVNPEVKEGDILNVVVVYEYTPVLYKANEAGELVVPYADWGKNVTYSGTSTSQTTPSTPAEGEENGTGTETGGNNG